MTKVALEVTDENSPSYRAFTKFDHVNINLIFKDAEVLRIMRTVREFDQKEIAEMVKE